MKKLSAQLFAGSLLPLVLLALGGYWLVKGVHSDHLILVTLLGGLGAGAYLYLKRGWRMRRALMLGVIGGVVSGLALHSVLRSAGGSAALGGVAFVVFGLFVLWFWMNRNGRDFASFVRGREDATEGRDRNA
jgi:hypothetical protein